MSMNYSCFISLHFFAFSHYFQLFNLSSSLFTSFLLAFFFKPLYFLISFPLCLFCLFFFFFRLSPSYSLLHHCRAVVYLFLHSSITFLSLFATHSILSILSAFPLLSSSPFYPPSCLINFYLLLPILVSYLNFLLMLPLFSFTSLLTIFRFPYVCPICLSYLDFLLLLSLASLVLLVSSREILIEMQPASGRPCQCGSERGSFKTSNHPLSRVFGSERASEQTFECSCIQQSAQAK